VRASAGASAAGASAGGASAAGASTAGAAGAGVAAPPQAARIIEKMTSTLKIANVLLPLRIRYNLLELNTGEQKWKTQIRLLYEWVVGLTPSALCRQNACQVKLWMVLVTGTNRRSATKQWGAVTILLQELRHSCSARTNYSAVFLFVQPPFLRTRLAVNPVQFRERD
jgi:hypothetical protein